MPSRELAQTLFTAKNKKLGQILEWIQTHGSQDMQRKTSETISQYNYVFKYFQTDTIRITHELAGRPDSIIHHIPSNQEQTQNVDIKKEIRNRKKIINGLIMEIEELRQLQ